ncbi:hypothetical protein [Arthrobacter livingstonensis]|nr:hypothetical protein [Arthrobacter livingstonensis]
MERDAHRTLRAAPGAFMHHIAMLQNGGDPVTTTIWGGHITDEDYNGS